jgi:hypothetical protein
MGATQSKPNIKLPSPLQNQESQLNQVNQLIQKANEAITCGPACQEQTKIEDLQKKYLNAQANVATAPQQLENAEKEYYTASKGAAYYSDFLRNKLQGKADILGNTLKSNFQKNIQLTTDFSQTYDSLSSNYQHILELFNGYVKSNESLKGEVNGVQKDIVTNDRKTYYEYEHFTSMKNWYYLFKWIYIILVFVFILGMFLVRNSYSLKYKIFLLVIFILYPFVIDFIVLYLIQLSLRLYSLLPTNIYTNL